MFNSEGFHFFYVQKTAGFLNIKKVVSLFCGLDGAAAAVSVKLSKEEIQRLEEVYQPHPVLGYS